MPDIGTAIGAGISLIGGKMSSDASKDAAKTQAASADKAAQVQWDMYNTTRGDLAPWVSTGTSANNRIADLLGLDVAAPSANTGAPGGYPSPGGSSSAPYYGGGSTTAPGRFNFNDFATNPGGITAAQPVTGNNLTPAQRQQQTARLVELQKWQTDNPNATAEGKARIQANIDNLNRSLGNPAGTPGTPGTPGAPTLQPQSEDHGSLLDFRPVDYVSPYKEPKTKFKLEDFQQDPGYLFRQQQGEQAINRAAAARGAWDSGGAYKDLARFNQGLASDEFANAYGRWADTYNRKIGRGERDYGKWSDAYNRDVGNKTNTFNWLNTTSTNGQNAAAQTGANATATGNSIADLYTGAGNATAAGQVGSANAWSNAGSNIWDDYQYSQFLKRSQPQRPTASVTGSSNGGW